MSYGSFWISFGIILSPWSGIVAAYGTDIAQLEHAIGYFLFGWAIFTLIIIVRPPLIRSRT
jgi:succinate-acetate transporter protein